MDWYELGPVWQEGNRVVQAIQATLITQRDMSSCGKRIKHLNNSKYVPFLKDGTWKSRKVPTAVHPSAKISTRTIALSNPGVASSKSTPGASPNSPHLFAERRHTNPETTRNNIQELSKCWPVVRCCHASNKKNEESLSGVLCCWCSAFFFWSIA